MNKKAAVLNASTLPRLVACVRSSARLAAGIVIATSVLVLIGWTLNLTEFETIRPEWAPTKPVAGVAFLCSGIALWLLCASESAGYSLATKFLGIAVASIGVVTLSVYDLTPTSNLALSPFIALPFVGQGVTLVLMSRAENRWPNLAQWLISITASFSLAVLVGFLFSNDAIKKTYPYSTIGIHAALSFMLISVGLLCARPEQGLMRGIIVDTVGGEVARRLLPLSLIVPLGLFIIMYGGYLLKFYDSRFGLALFTTANIIMLFAVVLRTASSMTNADLRRRSMEMDLQSHERRFRALIENSSDGIALIGADETILYASPVTTRILGHTTTDIAGLSAYELVHPDDSLAVSQRFRQALENPGVLVPVTARLQHVDGTWRHIEGVYTNLLADPSVQAVIVNFRDISDRKRLEQALMEAQKLESVGRLAGGVAHDFNNILTAIMGYSDLASREISNESPAFEDLKQVQVAADRAAALTTQLLAFARRQIIEPKTVNLNDLCLNLSSMLHRLIGENIHLEMVPEPNLRCVRVDPGQFEQIVINLAVNARDAMPDGGKLTIETSNVTLSQEYADEHGEVEPGEYVMLAISDTGAGIDEAIRLHIFEPFFTTKEQGRGTGLGLATCYGIVKQSGGHIWLYSEPGQGTTFRIYLPSSGAALEKAPMAVVKERSYPGTETILLVEDDPAVLGLAASALRLEGYRVLEARGGQEALTTVLESKVDLLVTDVIMPGMNGSELAKRLTDLDSSVKVLFASGYTENTIVHHGVLEPGISFLPKPFTPNSLTQKVREVLDTIPSQIRK